MDNDKLMAIQRAVRIVVEFHGDDPSSGAPATLVGLMELAQAGARAPRTTLSELIAKEIVEAIREEREACARKADSLAYRTDEESVRQGDRCDTAQKIARWIRERGKP